MVLSAKTSYKKQSGLLELTDTHLRWTQDGKNAASVRIALVDTRSE
jgi:transcription initiation factor TFIIH subunit 1